MYLVLLILSPDYLYLYAYVMLVWQLHSFYFDGYASLLRIFWKDMDKCNVIFVSTILFATQIVLTILYVLKIVKAYNLVQALTCINFALPTMVVISIVYLKCKFSGIPKRDEYKTRLKKLNMAVILWSMTRYLRAITSLWDANLFFGMMFEMDSEQWQKHTDGTTDSNDDLKPSVSQNNSSGASLIIPMSLIVIFVFVEIWPIWYVLDGNFIDIFLKYSVLIE